MWLPSSAYSRRAYVPRAFPLPGLCSPPKHSWTVTDTAEAKTGALRLLPAERSQVCFTFVIGQNRKCLAQFPKHASLRQHFFFEKQMHRGSHYDAAGAATRAMLPASLTASCPLLDPRAGWLLHAGHMQCGRHSSTARFTSNRASPAIMA